MTEPQRYARLEYVSAERWSDCSKPISGVRYMGDEVVETALVDTTQPIYVVDVGPGKSPRQIHCGDWVVYFNDGTKEIVSDTMFRSSFIDAASVEKALKALNAL